MKPKIVLEPSGEGGYTMYVPCVSEGNTVGDAIANYSPSSAQDP